MSRTASKSVALTVAAGVLTFGVQQLSTGEPLTGLLALGVGLVLFGGYQLAENADHATTYDEVADAIGEETFERLSEMGADELERRLDSTGADGDVTASDSPTGHTPGDTADATADDPAADTDGR